MSGWNYFWSNAPGAFHIYRGFGHRMYHSDRKDTSCLRANGANCVDKAVLGDPAFVQYASDFGHAR